MSTITNNNNQIIRFDGHALTAIPSQAESDQQLVDLWLHGRPKTTQRVYRRDANRFMQFVNRPLHGVTLGDLQAFADALGAEALEPSSRHRMLSAIKSLFAFGHRIGYLPFDIARVLRLPPLREKLSERILSEVEVQRMLALERHPRNLAILYLLYASGIRVSECCSLRWRDLQSREGTNGGGQITVQAKGAKTNTILIPRSVWLKLMSLRQEEPQDAPLFRSRRGGALDSSQMFRIVNNAAKRADIDKDVSPHWMRHAHASHALEHGAPIHLVQATLAHASINTTGRYLHARPSDGSARFLPL
jgi:integrase/recombinase XerD